MNAEEIKKLLPHRDPFLFIDKVLDLSAEHIVAERYVSPEESFFKGHFPEFPIMPGVLIVEAMAQTCGILGSHIMKQTASVKSVYLLCGVEKVRFRKKVMPGDTLRFKTQFITNKRKIWKFNSKAYKGSELVCSAEILCADGSLDE
tara:strand:+ start:3577 stop:4014 length:438 start_codon:yes stop_codon:yes gene_type:complete